MFEIKSKEEVLPTKEGTSTPIILETDGGMVPIMESDSGQKDKRKGKKLIWKEAKISLAHQKDNNQIRFGGTIQGGVDIAGLILLKCAIEAGFGTKTPIHGVGDGAKWIVSQLEKIFGANANYLLDLFHVCEYLYGAAKSISDNEKDQKNWVNEMKKQLKTNNVKEVIEELKLHLEESTIADKDAPVRLCHRYLSNRIDQLNYKDAIENGLPIGSGEIESAHRYIVQARLKLSGAWWKIDNAEHMLAMRINRANNEWIEYWNNLSKNSLTQYA